MIPENVSVNQIFKVPNTPQGKFFIEMAKEFLSPCYSVVCKGRTINRKKCKKQKISKNEIAYRQKRGSIPLGLSDNIGVYITLKNGGQRIGARDLEYYKGYMDKCWRMRRRIQEIKELTTPILELAEKIETTTLALKELSEVR